MQHDVERFHEQGAAERSGADITAEFVRRRRKVYGAIVLVTAGCGLLALSWLYAPDAAWIRGALVAVLLAIAAVSNLVFWRCPACGGHLGKLYIGLPLPKFCPNCGVRMLED